MDGKEAEHAELLMLFQDAARVREFYKKATFTYLAAYSGVAAFLVHFLQNRKLHTLSDLIIALWPLLLGIVLCWILVWSSHKHFRDNKKIANELSKDQFSEAFNKYRNIGNKIGTPDWVNILICCSALAYPILVLGWIILFLSENEYITIVTVTVTVLIIVATIFASKAIVISQEP